MFADLVTDMFLSDKSLLLRNTFVLHVKFINSLPHTVLLSGLLCHGLRLNINVCITYILL